MIFTKKTKQNLSRYEDEERQRREVRIRNLHSIWTFFRRRQLPQVTINVCLTKEKYLFLTQTKVLLLPKTNLRESWTFNYLLIISKFKDQATNCSRSLSDDCLIPPTQTNYQQQQDQSVSSFIHSVSNGDMKADGARQPSSSREISYPVA